MLSPPLLLFLCLCVDTLVVCWDSVVVVVFFALLFCWNCWVQTSDSLFDFRQPRTRSAAWATCTWLSATTPIPWQATNSVCCWRDKPSASLPRLANWATWAPCTQHWETSLMPFSATSSTWALQRYSIVFYVVFLDIHKPFFLKEQFILYIFFCLVSIFILFSIKCSPRTKPSVSTSVNMSSMCNKSFYTPFPISYRGPVILETLFSPSSMMFVMFISQNMDQSFA